MSGYWSALLRAALGPAVAIPHMHQIAEAEASDIPQSTLDRFDLPAERPIVVQANTIEQPIPPRPQEATSEQPNAAPVQTVEPDQVTIKAVPAAVAERPLSILPPPAVVLTQTINAPAAPPPITPPTVAQAIERPAERSVTAELDPPSMVTQDVTVHAEATPAPAPVPWAAPFVAQAAPVAVPPVAAATPLDSPPLVVLSIERIDIRITPPSSSTSAPRRRPPAPGPSLGDYLAGRGR